MLRLFFTDEARHDLLNIRSYTLAQWGSLKAKNYISELRKTLAQLQVQPLMGQIKAQT